MKPNQIITVVAGVLCLILIVAGLLWGCPQYNVWQKALKGKAALKEAEWNRQIAVKEAEARKESATLNKETSIIDAQAVAESNKIIGDSLRDNEAYLRFLWIKGLQDGSSEVIYIPTEAQIPILEAGKRPLTSKQE